MSGNNKIVIWNGKPVPRRQVTELGEEKFCVHCGEYWPLTNEFWYFQKAETKKNGIVLRAMGACKGCYTEAYKPERLQSRKSQIKSWHEVAA